MNEILRLEGISKKFGNRVLYKNFSFSFPKSGLFALVGPSGSGKSTLLDMISGIDQNYEGSIYVFGKKLDKRSETSRSYARLTKIGFIHQGYDLLELETALENVTLPLYACSYEKKRLIEKRATDLLSNFGMKKFKKSRIRELSGGEKQRVALARSVSTQARLLLADEPTGALDSLNAVKVYRYLKEISHSCLVLLVTHDEESAYTYADGILRIENEMISYSSNNPIVLEEKDFLALRVKKRKTLPFVPISFWFKHAIHLFFAKKRRALFSILILSISLLSLGTAIYLSYDANQEIDAAFSSLIGDNCIVMEKEGVGAAITDFSAATIDDIETILSFDSSIANGYGVKYSLDWNQFFPDFDVVYAISGTHKIELNNFSSSIANDFIFYDSAIELPFYPELPSLLEDDQIILGLPYANMVQLCLELKIARDYETLGEYLLEEEMNILFEVANSSWNYEDNELYSLVGVTRSDKPTIFHTNPLWNSYFFETRMRFPVTDGTDYPYPWVMQKIYYLRSSLNVCDFYDKVRRNKAFAQYLFERDSDDKTEAVNPLIEQRRYFVYFVKRNSFSFDEIEMISKKFNLPHYSIYGEQSYISFPSAMMSGFFHSFYLSKEKEELQSLVETLSVLPLEQKDFSSNLVDSIKEGSYRIPFSKSVTISSRIDSLLEGRAPSKANEVVLSKKLYEDLGKPKTIYASGEIEERESGDYIEKDYTIATLKVTGVSESNHDVLFVTKTWSIDFFRDELRMSSFKLEPTQVCFELDDDYRESLVDEMKAEFPLYHFENPFASISSSTESVIKFIRIALLFASISSLSISFLLLLTISILSIRENRQEEKMLFTLGISREDICSYYRLNVLLPLLVSTLISLSLVSLIEYFIHRQIGSSFSNAELPFQFSFLPLAFIVGSSLLAAFSLNIWLRFRALRCDFSKKG